MSQSKKLTAKQRRFVDEYLIDLNATQAAIRAGYSEKTAEQKGCGLKNLPHIAAAIEAGQAEIAERNKITQDMVLQELGKIAFANMLDYMNEHDGEMLVDLSTLTRDQAAAINEYYTETVVTKNGEDIKKTKFKLHDKRQALVDIGRYLGMFKDKVEHTGKDGADLFPQIQVSYE